MKARTPVNRVNLLQDKKKKRQLFLLHFAGGSRYSFDFLKSHLTTDLEFIPLEVPGRGKRFGESLLTDKKKAIEDYFNQIKALRNGLPYLIYGHSMGATLGLSVAKCMEGINDAPQHLIVSGNPGPGAEKVEGEEERGDRHLMNDEDFKVELKELGGVPEEVIENEELFSFFNPILRADFELLEKDDFLEEGTILEKTPIYAMMGSEEKSHIRIENWKRYTNNHFQYQILEGDHFFIANHPSALTDVFKNAMTNHRTSPTTK